MKVVKDLLDLPVRPKRTCVEIRCKDLTLKMVCFAFLQMQQKLLCHIFSNEHVRI